MKQGFSAGCSLEVTLKFADYENIKPSFWCGVSEEWDTDSETGIGRELLSEEQIMEVIKTYQGVCRKICEAQIDADIYDVKQVKLFSEVSKMKGGKE